MYDAYFISVRVAYVNADISGSFKLLITMIICHLLLEDYLS